MCWLWKITSPQLQPETRGDPLPEARRKTRGGESNTTFEATCTWSAFVAHHMTNMNGQPRPAGLRCRPDGSGYLPALAVSASFRVRTTWTQMTRGAHSGQHRYGNHRHGQNRCSKSIRTRSWLSAHTARMLHGECAGIRPARFQVHGCVLVKGGNKHCSIVTVCSRSQLCAQKVLEQQPRLLC